jgi:hypothetical protein
MDRHHGVFKVKGPLWPFLNSIPTFTDNRSPKSEESVSVLYIRSYLTVGVNMKMLSVVVMLILSISTFASTESRTFYYDGSQDSVQMILQAEQTHTEYRYEERHTICYRQETYYRTICRNTPQGRVCRREPHYRTVSYPCIQTIRIPYEVKDYDVEANVNLNIAAHPDLTVGETFKVTLDGDRIFMTASGSKKYFIILNKEEISRTVHGSFKLIKANYSASLVDAAPVVKALQMSHIELDESILSFKMGMVEARNLIGFRLNVAKAPILGSDTPNEIQLATDHTSSAASVNLQRLGVELSSGRYTITATAFFKHQGTLLNAAQFEKTEASRTLIYKIR